MDFSVRVSSSLLEKMGWNVPGYNSDEEKRAYLEWHQRGTAADNTQNHHQANYYGDDYNGQQNQHQQQQQEYHSSQTDESQQQEGVSSSTTTEQQESTLDTESYPSLTTTQDILKHLNKCNEGEKQPLPSLVEMLIWEAMQRDDCESEENLPLWQELEKSREENLQVERLIDVATWSLEEAATPEGITQKRESYLSSIPNIVWRNPLSLTFCYKQWQDIRRGHGNYFEYQRCVEEKVMGQERARKYSHVL